MRFIVSVVRPHFILIAATLVAIGCSGPASDRVSGIWKENQAPTSVVGAIASAFVPSSSLELKKDHTFLMKLPNLHLDISNNSGALETQSLVEGKWSVEGTKLSFLSLSVGGRPVADVQKSLLMAGATDSAPAATAGVPSAVDASQAAKSDVPAGVTLSTSKLALPEDASLSDDEKRLVVHFLGGVMPPVELTRDKS